MGFNNIAIVYIKGSTYRIHFWYMSKDDGIKIMNGSKLVHKRGVLLKKKLLYKNGWQYLFNLSNKLRCGIK